MRGKPCSWGWEHPGSAVLGTGSKLWLISVNQGYGPKNGLFPSDRSWSVLYSASQLNCVLWPDDIVCGLVSFYICDPKPAAVPQRSLQVHSTSLSSYSSTPLTMPHLLLSDSQHFPSSLAPFVDGLSSEVAEGWKVLRREGHLQLSLYVPSFYKRWLFI